MLHALWSMVWKWQWKSQLFICAGMTHLTCGSHFYYIYTYISLYVYICEHPSDVRAEEKKNIKLVCNLLWLLFCVTQAPKKQGSRDEESEEFGPIPWDLGYPKSVANIYCAFRLHFTFFKRRPFAPFSFVCVLCFYRIFFYLLFYFCSQGVGVQNSFSQVSLPLSLVKLKRFIETQLSCAFSRNAEDGRPSWWWWWLAGWMDGWMDGWSVGFLMGEEKKRRRHNVNYSNVEWCIT